jgi:hypothetical protein
MRARSKRNKQIHVATKICTHCDASLIVLAAERRAAKAKRTPLQTSKVLMSGTSPVTAYPTHMKKDSI